MSVRVKFVLVSVLLLLAVGITIIAAVATVQAIQGFQQQRSLLHAGDVRSVSDWMTIPYIARTYHVPADYLYQWLHITDKQKPVHATLRLLAARFHQPVRSVIQSVQAAIQAYRAQHSLAKTSGSTVEPLIGVGTGRLQGDTGHLRRIVVGGRTPARGHPADVKRIVMGGRTPTRCHPAPPTTPVPTMRRSPFCPCIVGTGEEWCGGVAPCGRPSSFLCDQYCPLWVPGMLKGGKVL